MQPIRSGRLSTLAILILLSVAFQSAAAPVPAAPASQPAARLPAPTIAAEEHNESIIKETFGAEYAKHDIASRTHLAQELLSQARQTKNDPASVYALLMQAIDVGSNAGDATTTLDAMADLERDYNVDLRELRPAALSTALRIGPSAGGAARLADAFVILADQALHEEDFPAADKWIAKAGQSAHVSRDAQLTANIEKDAARIRLARGEFERLKPMYDKLASDAHDPEANTEIGKFECFACDNWATGLPRLAIGADANLRAAATAEVRDPTDTQGRLALADAWWDAGAQLPKDKIAVQTHAGELYDLVINDLTGFAQTRVRIRLAEIAKLAPGGEHRKHLRLTWSCADVMDLYINGKPTRKVDTDFHKRRDESEQEFTAEIDLGPGDVLTLGARRGGAACFMLFGLDADGKLSFNPPASKWRVYTPADEANWFVPDTAMHSDSKPADVVKDRPLWLLQSKMSERTGGKVSSIWSNGATVAYFYYVCE